MIKTKIALAAMLMSLAFAPAEAAKQPAKSGKPAKTSTASKKSSSKKGSSAKSGKGSQYLTALVARRSGRRHRGRQVRRRRQADHSRRRHAREKARLRRRVARQIPQDRHAPSCRRASAPTSPC
jgi:hypothetical protein